MSIFLEKEHQSIKALLALYLDGKQIEVKDMLESIEDLKAEEDLPCLIEGVYLLSMYLYLSNYEDKDVLNELVADIDKQVKNLSSNNFSHILIVYKFLLVKILLGKQVNETISALHFCNIESMSLIEDFSLLGVLSLLIGSLGGEISYIEEGLRFSCCLQRVINSDGEVSVLFLSKEGVYKKDNSRVSVFLLLSLSEIYFSKNQLEGFKKLDPYEGGLFQLVDIDKKLLCRLLDDVKKTRQHEETTFEFSDYLEDLVEVKTEGFGCFTTTKKKVGIGGISYLDKMISPSFGPQILPLGNDNNYGVADPVSYEVEKIDHQLKMWNRVKSNHCYGNHWIHSSVSCEGNKCLLDFFPLKMEKQENLAIVFFIRANYIEVENKRYDAGNLYRSNISSDKILLFYDYSTLKIELKKQLSVEIIPLAGQDYFWNSDFILSFPLEEDTMLSLELLMD